MTEAASSDLALLSHELRTPIAAIMGLADGMVEAAFGPLNATYREHAALIHQAGDHLLALADNLAGDGLGQPQSTDVGALILNVAALMGKTVRTDVAQPIVLRVDAQALRQILYNLLANAVKYSPTDSQIEVSAAIDAKHLTIEITNPTRPAEALPDLSGAGVGLALSARLCSRLGGALNWPGDDTGQFKATVSLPLPQSDGRSA